MQKIWVSWSSGKDSAWVLHRLLQEGHYEVTGLVTTISERFQRVSMHGVRAGLLRRQAEVLGLPLHLGKLPWPCPNFAYEQVMQKLCQEALDEGVSAIAFGDLFLEDIRAYREEKMAEVGMDALFPLWGIPTSRLINDILNSGLKATISCVDSERLDAELAGVVLDHMVVASLGEGIDPCGENGEFHTFVWEAPIFSTAISIQTADIYHDGQYVFRDLVESSSVEIKEKGIRKGDR